MQETFESTQEGSPIARVIVEWQRPVYNLAYRMLGNEADAADATQDVFLAIVRQWERYDAARPLKPWLLRVALNRIRNFRRGSAARARREREASRSSVTSGEGDFLENEDLKQRVHFALARLPESDRALIVLHYYSGLSHAEMGAALALPRTTVQARLGKALERLRVALAGIGCMVSATGLEAAMRATAAIDVPVGLSASLSALPAAALAAPAATNLLTALGGWIMTKKLIAAAVLGCLLIAGGAYTTGRRIATADLEARLARERAVAVASTRSEEELRAERAKLATEVKALRARLEKRSKTEAGPKDSAGARSAETAKAAGEKGGDSGKDAEAALDWSKFSALFADRLDLLYEIQTSGRDRSLTKDERKRLAEVEGALMEVLTKARQMSDEPFFDKRVLFGLCQALCVPALGVDGERAEKVREAISKAIEDQVESFDRDAALPAETHRARQSFLSELQDGVGGSLEEGEQDAWRKISALARQFLEGDHQAVFLPSAPAGGAEAREASVVSEWQKAFAFADEQSAQMRPFAADFIARADEARAQYGQLEPSPRHLTPAEKSKLAVEMLDIQIEIERGILRHLTPEQREALHGRAPLILGFAPGNQNWSDVKGSAF